MADGDEEIEYALPVVSIENSADPIWMTLSGDADVLGLHFII